MHENAVSKQRKSKAIKTGMDLHTKKEYIQPFSAVKRSTHSYGNEHLLLSNSLHLGTKRRHMRDIMHRPMERLLSAPYPCCTTALILSDDRPITTEEKEEDGGDEEEKNNKIANVHDDVHLLTCPRHNEQTHFMASNTSIEEVINCSLQIYWK